MTALYDEAETPEMPVLPGELLDEAANQAATIAGLGEFGSPRQAHQPR